jgi:hypothetical protein
VQIVAANTDARSSQESTSENKIPYDATLTQRHDVTTTQMCINRGRLSKGALPQRILKPVTAIIYDKAIYLGSFAIIMERCFGESSMNAYYIKR